MNRIEGIKPVGTKVLVKIVTKEVEKLHSTSIILDIDDTPKPTDRCIALNIGTTVELIDEGKKYIYSGWGTEVEYRGEKYVLMDEKNFLAEVDEP